METDNIIGYIATEANVMADIVLFGYLEKAFTDIHDLMISDNNRLHKVYGVSELPILGSKEPFHEGNDWISNVLTDIKMLSIPVMSSLLTYYTEGGDLSPWAEEEQRTKILISND